MLRYPHEIELAGGTKVVTFLPDVYGSIGTVLGITKVDADSPGARTPASLQQLRASGAVHRVRVRYTPSGGGAAKFGSIVCSGGKEQDLYKLVGLSYRGGTIRSAKIPQRAIFG